MIKIDKGYTMPDFSFYRRAKYPFREMEVGDSFFAAGRSYGQFSSYAATAGKRIKKVFRCKEVTEGGVKGLRCWRVKE